jgi:hypothetical protein
MAQLEQFDFTRTKRMIKKILIIIVLPFFYVSSYAENAFQIPTAPEPENTIPAASNTPPVINCNYPIPASINTIDTALLETWAEKAIMQSFDFNSQELDQQLEKLKPCFTEQGWQSFYDALKASGNLEAIKSQNLSVSCQIDGKLNINSVKENQWKVIIPLQVVYQNDKEKITQLLSVELLVGRRASGNLGIMQVIATPRQLGESTK